eukprot:127773_1
MFSLTKISKVLSNGSIEKQRIPIIARYGLQTRLQTYSLKSPKINSFEINTTKSSMEHTYYEETPLHYIQRLVPLDYGQYHDVFVNFANPLVNELLNKKEKLKIVDLGCSYGNSSLALIDNLSWNETISFWMNQNKKQIKNKSKYDVIGVDASENALLYGVENGIYDEIFVQDFNKDFDDKLQKHIVDADILICLMATNYMFSDVWARSDIVNSLFLKERNKANKLLLYNQVCLFQKEDISPDILLNKQNNWNSNKIFTKHRLLTPEESSANKSNKESWTYVYGVMCNKLNN